MRIPIKHLSVLIAVLALLCVPAYATTYNAATCSQADIQTAIGMSSVDGDIISVPAGSCTWTSRIIMPTTHAITLQGAGVGNTIITDGNATTAILEFIPRSTYTEIVRITGFTFDNNGQSKPSNVGMIQMSEAFGSTAPSGLNSFRVDNNDFKNLAARALYLFMRGNDVSGVIDHNTFEVPYNSTIQAMAIVGDVPESSTPFNRAFTPGTEHAIYVETNTFTFDFANDGCYDAYGGARYVFRFNTCLGTITGPHGADSGTYRGIAQLEQYNNVHDNNGHGVSRVAFFRSGAGYVFNNTVTGTYTAGIVAAIFRSNASFKYWGQCNGNAAWDVNTPGSSGYPCLDQVGHFFSGGGPWGGTSVATVASGAGSLTESGTTVTATTTSAHGLMTGDWILIKGSTNASYSGVWQVTGTPTSTTFTYTCDVSGLTNSANGTVYTPAFVSDSTLQPYYSWSNTLNGSQLDTTRDSGTPSAYLVENTDYYNEDASFDGTSGIGVGVRASRPATCTTGVGYWSTDQGSWNSSGSGGNGVLDVCTATDTWTNAYYTPYNYPHPLVQSDMDDPVPPTPSTITPTNVTASGMTLTWDASTDASVPSSSLSYLVYVSSINNIDTVANAEANGTPVGSYTLNNLTYDITNQISSTDFWWNVLVRDPSGNKAAYTSLNQATSACTHLGFTSQPAGGVLGSAIGTVSVSLLDAGDNVCSGDTDTITLSKNASATWGTLTTTTNLAKAATAGVATWTSPDLKVTTTAGIGAIDAAASGLTGATSSNMTISSMSSSLPLGIGRMRGRR